MGLVSLFFLVLIFLFFLIYIASRLRVSSLFCLFCDFLGCGLASLLFVFTCVFLFSLEASWTISDRQRKSTAEGAGAVVWSFVLISRNTVQDVRPAITVIA